LTPDDWELVRYPATSDRSLQALDAADRLALAELGAAEQFGRDGGSKHRRVLVVNEAFGALTIPLVAAGAEVTVWADSVHVQTAVERNLERNELGHEGVGFIQDVGLHHTNESFDAIVVKVPKSLAHLRFELGQLRRVAGEATRIIGAGMVRHIHTSTVDAFDSMIGPTVTSLASRKARLILPTFDADRSPVVEGAVRYRTEAGIDVISRPGVFSQSKLDIGTRLLLDHLPKVTDGAHVLDLGCGNGVVGASLGARFTGGSVTFSDISNAAVASAHDTWRANQPDSDRAHFLWVDLAAGVPDASIDVVVVNPPFHDQHVVGDETARRMFAEAHRVLRPGGELRVVGNRHLGYHRRLSRMFNRSRTVASNAKFVVLSAVAD